MLATDGCSNHVASISFIQKEHPVHVPKWVEVRLAKPSLTNNEGRSIQAASIYLRDSIEPSRIPTDAQRVSLCEESEERILGFDD